MRIVVVSDTHVPRFRRRLPEALARVAAERPDAIVHCGDFTTLEAADAFAALAPFEGVAGNNDGPEIVARFGRRTVLAFGGLRVGVVHGDGVGGTTLERARAAFAVERLAAIVFGHSHVPYAQRHDETWVVNPGSATDKRRERQFSYAVLEIDAQRQVRPRIVRFGPE